MESLYGRKVAQRAATRRKQTIKEECVYYSRAGKFYTCIFEENEQLMNEPITALNSQTVSNFWRVGEENFRRNIAVIVVVTAKN